MNTRPTLSIIIPLAVDENLWRQLLSQLHIETGDEIILASTQDCPSDWLCIKKPLSTRWLQCEQNGRAAQMNAAAKIANGDYLWFVHADSKLPSNGLSALKQSINKNPMALHYFDLRFYDGGWKMRINEWGVRFRCAIFKNPFGDQAFCLSPSIFSRIGGYDENAPYGEDHLLAITVREHNVPLIRIPLSVETAARRYIDEGWLRTIVLFQRLWFTQWRKKRLH